MYQCHWYDGKSSTAHPATIWLENQLINVKLVTEKRSYTNQQVTLEPVIHSLPVKMTFFDGSCLILQSDNDLAEFEHFLKPPLIRRWIRRLEKNFKVAILCFLLIVFGVLGFINFGIPALAKPIAEQVPDHWLQALDKEVMDLLVSNNLINHRPIGNYQNGRIDSLMNELTDDAHKYNASVYSSSIGANALALPGGSIIVTKAFMDMNFKDAEIKSVLAHEIGHVDLKHGVRGIIQNASVTALFSMLLGDVSAFAQLALVSAPTLLKTLSYGRNFEREADSFSIVLLDKLGIPRSCLADALKKLEQQHSESTDEEKNEDENIALTLVTLLSTHPSTRERVQYAKNSLPCK